MKTSLVHHWYSLIQMIVKYLVWYIKLWCTTWIAMDTNCDLSADIGVIYLWRICWCIIQLFYNEFWKLSALIQSYVSVMGSAQWLCSKSDLTICRPSPGNTLLCLYGWQCQPNYMTVINNQVAFIVFKCFLYTLKLLLIFVI